MLETKIQQGLLSGVIPSPYDERDFTYAIMPEKVERPETFSLRDKQTPVRDQGAIGTCAAFGGCAVNEFLHEGKTILSPRHLYCARANAPQEGMIMRDVCKIMQKRGVCTEQCWKYISHSSLCKSGTPCIEALDEALRYRIGTYRRIYGSIKDALYINKAPLFACVPIYDGFPNISGKMRGYHAITITGYTTNLFEFKNSWGKIWKDEGYSHIIDTYPVAEAWLLEMLKEDDTPDMTIEIEKATVDNACFWGLPVKVHVKVNAMYQLRVEGGWSFTSFIKRGDNNFIVYVPNKQCKTR